MNKLKLAFDLAEPELVTYMDSFILQLSTFNLEILFC